MKEERPTQLQEPLAVAYLASVLINDGHKVQIKDFDAEIYKKNDFLKYIKRFSPDLLGVSCFTSSFPFAKKIIDVTKEWKSELPISIGGIHASIESAENIFNSTNANFVVHGEGEKTILELVNVIERGNLKMLKSIKGISFKENGKFYTNGTRELIENLDSLPFPARHLLPMELYKSSENLFGITLNDIGKKKLLGNILSSRGCPFNCIYCCSLINRRRIRLRSAANVYEELEILVNDYKRDGIYFVDDQLTFDRKRLTEICNLIIKNKLDIQWRCQSRVDKVDRDILTKMKRAGCTSITYGTETGDPNTLRLINKKTTLEKGERTAKLTKRLGIHSRCNFMLGFPWDTHNSIKKTIMFAAKIDPNSSAFYLTTPYPGTGLWDYAIQQKIVKEDMDWESFTNKEPHFITKNVSKRDVDKYLKFAEIFVLSRNVHKEIFNPDKWYGVSKDFMKTKDFKKSIRFNLQRTVNLIGSLKVNMKGKTYKERISYLYNQFYYHLKIIFS